VGGNAERLPTSVDNFLYPLPYSQHPNSCWSFDLGPAQLMRGVAWEKPRKMEE
jgi:hypothetical protein